MDTLIRVARVMLILVLAFLAVSFIMGLARPETGVVEKVGLVALLAACVFLAAKVTDWTTRLRDRVSTHQKFG
jgi:hypothetical protein